MTNTVRRFRFSIVNVFAETTLAGNPLCVFEDASGMSDDEMQALARQFNLSETTFVLPSAAADARVRIFTPSYEMPFAGHPSLGTGWVVARSRGMPAVVFEMIAGLVNVVADGDRMTLTTPDRAAVLRAPTATGPAIAALVGLAASDLVADPVWVDTGADQLLVPLGSIEAVERAHPDSARLAEWPLSSLGRRSAYLFHVGEPEQGVLRVTARYFFTTQGGGVSEDPGTGSACANLGAWLAAQGRPLPIRARVDQGRQVGRACVLDLEVTAERRIHVGGRVVRLAEGTVEL